ncbi:MAG: DUF6478 family protein [Pseudomonadota bacterium]
MKLGQKTQVRSPAGAANASGAAPPATPSALFAVFDRPLANAWSDGPVSGDEICPGLTIYHDAGDSLFYWRQRDLNLEMTVYQFQGTYLSLAAGMPAAMISMLGPGRGVSATIDATASRPVTVFFRLNLDLPDGRETLHETFVLHRGERQATFDLDGVTGRLDAARDAWLDLILADPAMTELTIHNLDVDVFDV